MRVRQLTGIDFTALAGDGLLEELDKEFQYQMDLTDGCYVIWHEELFQSYRLTPAESPESQAILQFFADCACPISSHRLGCSLSPRNAEHGPITSDGLAINYLLQGFETISNWKYDPKIHYFLNIYRATKGYQVACELLATYLAEINTSSICPEVFDTILEMAPLGGKH